jgi:putative DNA primase/helicase
MHAVDATVAGSGKSKIVDIACTVATGEKAPVAEAGKDGEELKKLLSALLFAGASFIALDNVEAPLGGAFLCQCLTQERVTPRVLGKSKAPETSSGASITGTGNKLQLVGDLTRRTLLCSLDPRCERPELRVFDRDPVAYAKANRPALVVAAITILHAYNYARRPDKPVPLGSFEEWSDLVRGALLWVGCADPIDSMETVRTSDPNLGRRATVMAQWKAIIGSDRVTVADVIKRATERCPPAHGGEPEFVHDDLREALLVVAGHNGAINSGALGKWLSGNAGRVLSDRRFEQAGLRHGVVLWQLAKVE